MNIHFKLFICAFSCLFVSNFANPQENNDLKNYSFKNINIKDGLSQSSILSILQDRKGFMWFGTANGLNRYDGYEFLVYTNDPTDSTSISNNEINTLFEDFEGNLWIGTRSGILNKFESSSEQFKRFDIASSSDWFSSEEEKFYTYPITFSRNKTSTITSVAQDSSGVLWIGTWGKGLIKFNPKTHQKKYYYHFKNKIEGLSSNKITKILIDSNNDIWIGTFGGGLNKIVSQIKNKTDILKFQLIRSSNKDLNIRSKISTLFEDNQNNLWIGTYGEGTFTLSLNNKSKSFGNHLSETDEIKYNVENLKFSNKVMSITQDQDSSIWIGTSGDGVYRIKNNKFTVDHFSADSKNPNSLSENEVQSLLVDKSGILWIGSQLGGGINKLEHRTTKFFKIPTLTDMGKSLNDNIIWSIYEDSKKNLFVGTYRGGLNIIDGERKNFSYFGKDKINDVHVRSIIEDKRGNFWIGTYSGGLTFYDKNLNTFENFMHDKSNPHSLSFNQIQSLYIEDDSLLWIGTFGGGLCLLNLDDFYNNHKIEFNSYKHNPSDNFSISDDRVYSIFQSKEGDLWIGTHGGGINKFDIKSRKFTNYLSNNHYAKTSNNGRVMVITETLEGSLLIGTFGGGLDLFNPTNNTFLNLNEKIGLDCNDVYGILVDSNKSYWLSTDKGIYNLSNNLQSFSKYDLEDGLQSLEFNGGAYFKSTDGTFYFGGINGVNYFNPHLWRLSDYVPQVVISKVTVFDKPIKGKKDKIVLGRDQNYFSFEFASLDYENSSKNKYKYMLEGLDKNWMYSDSKNRKVFYTNIDPGDYRFIVHGTNSDGKWSPYSASVEIKILAPLWMQWWFIAGLILLIGGLVTFYINQRIRYLVAMDELKTNLSADLHDNVGAGLTEISILSELAAHNIDKQNLSVKYLNQISNMSRQLVESMSDIVWVVNPNAASLYDLIVRLKDNYGELLSDMGVSLETSNLEKLRSVKLVMDYRQNLYLILKESFNNCLKHSNCTLINLDILISGNNLQIKLIDNGDGFNSEKTKFGNGLKNIKERAKKIGGIVTITSGINKGTTIEFKGHIK